ncbi:MAG: type II secretion system protein GspN [Geobacteraceae bacterium]|nr:type II secretion system protein GspN [Geobacteraceae bacterium]
MTRPGLVRGAVLSCAWLSLFLVCVYLFFPSRRINDVIDRVLLAQGLNLTPAAHKTFLPGLGWDNALLSSRQGPLLRFDRVTVRPLLLKLLTGRIVLSSSASLGSGHLMLEQVLGGRQSVHVAADKLALGEIPFFKTILGARATGSIWTEGHVTREPQGWNGELRLEISRLGFNGIRMGAFLLPDVDNLNSKGMIRLTAGKARLESLALQGEGIYMRLSGDLPLGVNADAAPLDLLLEIMPKPEFLEKQKLVFMLLAKFMASPGVYRVPIRGTLLKPEIL